MYLDCGGICGVCIAHNTWILTLEKTYSVYFLTHLSACMEVKIKHQTHPMQLKMKQASQGWFTSDETRRVGSLLQRCIRAQYIRYYEQNDTSDSTNKIIYQIQNIIRS